MIQFTCRGHKNVLSLHYNTVEFTHDTELTLRGDCILAVSADYVLDAIVKEKFTGKIKITIEVNGFKESIEAVYNTDFNDAHEMVIRKSEYVDARTFAIRADKAAKDIDRKIVAAMKGPKAVMIVVVEQLPPSPK
jgi:uncharacterized protein